ncbi:MAG: DNA polymerase III subunit gamma/tau, partial [Flavobacteriaceae bacterium]
VIDENDLPHDSFTEKEMQHLWEQYVDKLDNSGRKILASNLSIDKPSLEGENTLCIQLPNHTMKKEIEREKSGLMDYLKAELNNHEIQLKIMVQEDQAKQFVYTPEEKYEKLKEKNPAIDLLRKEFDLDL